jgi:hypothetical protein
MTSVSRLWTIAAIAVVSVAGGVSLLLAVVTSEHPGSAAMSVCGGLVLGGAFVAWAHWIGRKRAAKRPRSSP